MMNLSLILGMVGVAVAVFSFALGCLGMIFPNVINSSARRDVFFRYFSALVISSIISILAIHASNIPTSTFIQWGIYGGLYGDIYYQLSITVFFVWLMYGAFIGTGICVIGLVVGTIWPRFLFHKKTYKPVHYWSALLLSLLVLGFACFGGLWAWSSSYQQMFACGQTPFISSCRMHPHPAKPVIYLYPTHEEPVSVTLNYAGTLTSVYPSFNNGTTWKVTADPDGTLIDEGDGQPYSYLFWEGEDDHQYDLSTGFVVKGSDTASFLQHQLAAMGLTPREYNEMIVYWLPKMQNNPYNLIHFAGADYTNIAKLTIAPNPDSLLRVFMVWKPLSSSQPISPQTFPAFERKGFTVVEWGGTEL